jgi:hypothetical protein
MVGADQPTRRWGTSLQEHRLDTIDRLLPRRDSGSELTVQPTKVVQLTHEFTLSPFRRKKRKNSLLGLWRYKAGSEGFELFHLLAREWDGHAKIYQSWCV